MLSGYADFEPWQQWSSCSKQCGGGKRSRNRSCTSISIPCSGGSKEEEDCNTQACSITTGEDFPENIVKELTLTQIRFQDRNLIYCRDEVLLLQREKE